MGQATRALFAILACSAVGYFWGRLTASWGSKWCWLAPTAMAAGWALGQTVCDIYHSGSFGISDLKDVPEDSLEKLETIAFLPLLLIGLMALAGTLWNHYRRIHRVSCVVLIPIMMLPIIWDTKLTNRREEFLTQQMNAPRPLHEVSQELTGAVRLDPSPEPLFDPPTLPSTSADRKVWEFALPWKATGDDPRIRLIVGGSLDTHLSSSGASVNLKPWRFQFLRNTVDHLEEDAPLLLRVIYEPKRQVDPASKGLKTTVFLPPPSPPKELRVRAKLVLQGFEILNSFPAVEPHQFRWHHVQNGSIRAELKNDYTYLKDRHSQEIWLEWCTQSWHPVPAISGAKDQLLDSISRPRAVFALTLTYQGRTTWPEQVSHSEEQVIGFNYEAFFRIQTYNMDTYWEFPIPVDAETREHFLADTTVTHFNRIAIWEIPIELDLALP